MDRYLKDSHSFIENVPKTDLRDEFGEVPTKKDNCPSLRAIFRPVETLPV